MTRIPFACLQQVWHFAAIKTATALVLVLLLPACALFDVVPDGLSEARNQVVLVAMSNVGMPYSWGNDGPFWFDDDGLTHYVFEHAGSHLPRYLEDQVVVGRKIKFSKIRPGDLLIYNLQVYPNSEPAPHVGIYIGDGEMIHASYDEGKVSTATITHEFWRKRFKTALQILP